MKKRNLQELFAGICLLVLFMIWTVAVCYIDVQPIGPKESTVGFATLNRYIHNITGVHFTLYNITDWLGLVPIGFMFGFALLGLVQLIKRKGITKVDPSILALGVFYAIVVGVYLLFEVLAINYRPTLINGYLEASYPSSTTMLVMCIIPTAIMQLKCRCKRKLLPVLLSAFTVFMVIGRLISGVHWITDIIGSILLSRGLVLIYRSIAFPNKR